MTTVAIATTAEKTDIIPQQQKFAENPLQQCQKETFIHLFIFLFVFLFESFKTLKDAAVIVI